MFEQPADFRDESQALHALLEPLADADYDRPTQFKGWTINEVLTHLHMWNWAADKALTDEAGFLAFVEHVMADRAGGLRPFENRWIGDLKGRALREAWRKLFGEIADHFAAADPKARVKWVGPDMSVRSSITARLMETWAHGQAVYDLLGVERQNTDRIRNIVVLGANTYGFNFKIRGEEPPQPVPHLRLSAPSGEVWTFNEPSDTECIEGSAVDFCQTVTQVRNVADTALKVTGPNATRWMAIAQCFAGAPNDPPAPGSRFRVAA
ncbi:MAG: TIGR03084 family protein [Burkholderiaceae bacterium]|nr:TIGR03084 family protein [Burkholderiaceae bacterium]